MNPRPNEPVLAEIVERPKSSRAANLLAVLGMLGGAAFLVVVGSALLVVMLASFTGNAPARPGGGEASEAGILHVDDSTFDAEILSAAGPETIVVDFYADWCGPCRLQGPILARFAESHPDVKIAKVDVDASPNVAARYNIRSIPTLLIVKNGKVAGRNVGLASEADLTRLVEKK